MKIIRKTTILMILTLILIIAMMPININAGYFANYLSPTTTEINAGYLYAERWTYASYPYSGRGHTGVDITAFVDKNNIPITQVKSVAYGKVVEINNVDNNGFGKYVVIETTGGAPVRCTE